MRNLELKFIELSPNDNPQFCIIWLHGLGADGHDFLPIASELELSKDHAVRFVFPHAPIRPVTLNGGMQMRAWYDIYPGFIPEDEAGIRLAQQQVNQLIEQEIQRGIPSKNIILAGFSQGGAVALYSGLRYSQPLGGIIGLSTYLPLSAHLSVEATAVNQKLPIFMAHGRYDDIIPCDWAKECADFLQQQYYDIDFHLYPMAHQVCPQEIQDIQQWLLSHLRK